ncbi:MAG: M81 family metallopeptidase, partial [Trueperaceae bacterium]
MTRILLVECTQEVASFNPVPSRYPDFQVRFGEDILAFHNERSTEGGGALEVFSTDPEIELIPSFSAKAITSGGTLERSSFERISRELVEAVAAAPPVDGVYFCLHGAMSAEGEVDPEGYFVEEV